MSDVGERSLPPQQQPVLVIAAPRPATNAMAVTAFVLAFFVGIAGVILGYIALAQIKRTGEDGHGFALAAVVLGWISVIGTVVLAVAALLVGSFVLKLY